MEVIAETTEGFLISATTSEVKEIVRSVQGTAPDFIQIGQKIPAIDYAATLTKLKGLPEELVYTELLRRVRQFNEEVDLLNRAVDSVKNL